MLPSENQSAAFAKEVDELKRYFQGIQQERDSQPPLYVYHYTSLRNLHSILESKTIRLYDLMDMKDQQEFPSPPNDQRVNEAVLESATYEDH
jgi:hypothetical protein